MKISTGFIKTAFEVQATARADESLSLTSGKKYDCFLQSYEGCNGEYTRFNIGINGWHEWNFVCYMDEEQFNRYFIIL